MPIKAIILSLCLLAALCTRAADEQKIDSIVSQMTLEEKVGLCYGNFMHFRGVERLNIPEVGWCDGPRGPNGQGGSTAFPSGILMGATWNPETIEKPER